MKINFSCYHPKRLNIKKGLVKVGKLCGYIGCHSELVEERCDGNTGCTQRHKDAKFYGETLCALATLCDSYGVAFGQALRSYCTSLSHGPVSAAILNAN